LYKTIDYYNKNAEKFIKDTLNLDVEELYKPFLKLIPSNSTILDAGAGSGRDTLYFMNKGFSVVSIDASESIVEHCTRITGKECLLMNFEQMDFRECFEGIWACASLLHIQRVSIDNVFFKLYQSLKPNGVLYASFKYGEKEELKNERYFNNYDEKTFAELIGRHPYFKIITLYITEDVRPDKPGEKWLNVLVIRSS